MAKKKASPASPFVPAEEPPYRIPDNWCWTKLGAFIDIYRGVSYKKDDAHTVKSADDCLILRGGNILEGAIDLDADNIYVDRKLVQETQLIKKHDVIIVSSTGSSKVIGRAGISYSNYTDVAFGAFLTLARPKQIAVKQFVDLFFQSELYRGRIRQLASGVNINNIRMEYITDTPFPLPPFPEQQRIVTRIESLFAKLDEAKEKAQVVVDGFELRKSAILHKAFTGELTEWWRKENGVGLDSWIVKTSGELFEYVTSGSRGWAQYYSDSGAMFIRMGNLDHGTIELDLSDIQYVNLPDKAEGQRSLLHENDILISITADVGMIGLVREIDFEAYINQHIALARPTGIDNPEFIAWYLVSDVGLQQMQRKQRGATKVGLGLDDIRSIELSVPDVNEQDEIVRILDGLLTQEQQAKEAAEAVLDQINTMKKAILARAFRGELGTNDPAEEWAGKMVKNEQ